MDDVMPIGEFSDLSGLSPKRLRSYASAGLLVPAAVDAESGYRYYTPGQLRDARLIDALRRADVPLVEIGILLRDPSPERLDEWARQIEVDTTERHEALRHARDLLEIDAGSTRRDAADDAGKDLSMHLTATARSDTGRVRDTNQDRNVCLDH